MAIILDRQIMLVNPWGENIAQFCSKGRTMAIILDRQIMLVNPWGENVAQFWIVINDAYDQKWVHCFPYASMHVVNTE